ncbi:MAG: sugar ABC transporter permease [Clostridia bacterium]|nr:sugar ABC transporter permease [Clostridia bacterium]
MTSVSTFTQEQLKEMRRIKHRSWLVSYAMILPAVLFLLAFVLYPTIAMFIMSLYYGNAVNPYKKFKALDNYKVRPDFWVALRNTAEYTGMALVLVMILSILFAQWMYKSRKLNNVAQTVFFTPHLVAGVSAGFIWSWLMSSQPYGLFNTVFNSLGLSSVRWLDDTSTAMFSIVLMNTWKNVGYYCLIIMSAMKSIPTEIYESAQLDGSSSVKTFFKITVPMISPQLFFLLITITTGSFKVFDSVRIMTNGGPGDATRVLSMYIYDYAFERNNTLGYACAAGILMMLIMVAVAAFDFGFVEKKVHYQ